jgi:hypothetical protein
MNKISIMASKINAQERKSALRVERKALKVNRDKFKENYLNTYTDDRTIHNEDTIVVDDERDFEQEIAIANFNFRTLIKNEDEREDFINKFSYSNIRTMNSVWQYIKDEIRKYLKNQVHSEVLYNFIIELVKKFGIYEADDTTTNSSVDYSAPLGMETTDIATVIDDSNSVVSSLTSLTGLKTVSSRSTSNSSAPVQPSVLSRTPLRKTPLKIMTPSGLKNLDIGSEISAPSATTFNSSKIYIKKRLATPTPSPSSSSKSSKSSKSYFSTIKIPSADNSSVRTQKKTKAPSVSSKSSIKAPSKASSKAPSKAPSRVSLPKPAEKMVRQVTLESENRIDYEDDDINEQLEEMLKFNMLDANQQKEKIISLYEGRLPMSSNLISNKTKRYKLYKELKFNKKG